MVLLVKVKSLSCVRLFMTLWTVAHQAPPSMEFSRQEYWSRLPFPALGDLPDPGIEPLSPALAGDFFTTSIIQRVVGSSLNINSDLKKSYLRVFILKIVGRNSKNFP